MMHRVLIPPALRSYTGGAAEVRAPGATLAELLADLEARHPGLRFRIIDEHDRIRAHIWIFVDGRLARETSHPMTPVDEVQIVPALSGG